MTTKPTFILHLQPVRPDGDPTQALRLALKRLLRDHGLRCVSVQQDPPITTPPTTVDHLAELIGVDQTELRRLAERDGLDLEHLIAADVDRAESLVRYLLRGGGAR